MILDDDINDKKVEFRKTVEDIEDINNDDIEDIKDINKEDDECKYFKKHKTTSLDNFNIYEEKFDSTDSLIKALRDRPENKLFKERELRSKDNDKKFFGTESYDEAEKMLQYGYDSKLSTFTKDIDKAKKLQKKLVGRKTYPINDVVGYIPHVPNLLKGIPETMINIKMKPVKQKTMWIFYIMTESWTVNPSTFYKAGKELLRVIYYLEKQGISVKLNACFFFGYQKDIFDETKNELCCASLSIKDYGQKLDLQKVSFPLMHPSMLRRIGFRWLEINQNISLPGWYYGYGYPCKDDIFINNLNKIVGYDDIRVISVKQISDAKFKQENILKILKYE